MPLSFREAEQPALIVGQDAILRAGWQPAPTGLLTRVPAGYQPAAGCQPAPQLLQNSRWWLNQVALGTSACATQSFLRWPLLHGQVSAGLGGRSADLQHHQVVAAGDAGHQNINLVFAGKKQPGKLDGGGDAADGGRHGIGRRRRAGERLAEVRGWVGGTETSAEEKDHVAGLRRDGDTRVQVGGAEELVVRSFGCHVFPPQGIEHEQRGSEGRLGGIQRVAGLARVGDLHGHRSLRRIGRRQHVELRGADVVDVRRLTVDGDADLIELGGEIAAVKVGARPDARGAGKARTRDGGPGALRNARQETGSVHHTGDDGACKGSYRQGERLAAGAADREDHRQITGRCGAGKLNGHLVGTGSSAFSYGAHYRYLLAPHRYRRQRAWVAARIDRAQAGGVDVESIAGKCRGGSADDGSAAAQNSHGCDTSGASAEQRGRVLARRDGEGRGRSYLDRGRAGGGSVRNGHGPLGGRRKDR